MNREEKKIKARPWLHRWLRSKIDASVLDQEELIIELRQAQKNNIISLESLGMLEGVMQVDNLQVRDIMIPRVNVGFLHLNDSYHDILKTVMKAGHSRFPVIDENKDHVEGILLAKDLLKYVGNEGNFNINDILRTPSFVPESQKLNTLLSQFRNSRNHMAIVVDEYSGVSGLVTIEDVLEQIVGDIDDEHDAIDEKKNILAQSDGRFTIQASTDLEEFNEYFHCDMPTDQYDTLGGLVSQKAGRIPRQGEEVNLNNFLFKILRSDGRRIQLLEVRKLEKL
ncbi:MAG: magnesium/cobalt efflux protein [Thiotrichales bacterium]|nr:MAG: magnesium/cobalt efflux protein [Thiotrichales bacterium]